MLTESDIAKLNAVLLDASAVKDARAAALCREVNRIINRYRAAKLTAGEKRVHQTIMDFIDCHGARPTMQNIADQLGLAKVSVYGQVVKLREKGVLMNVREIVPAA